MNRFLPMPEIVRAVSLSFCIAVGLVGVMIATAAHRRRARIREKVTSIL